MLWACVSLGIRFVPWDLGCRGSGRWGRKGTKRWICRGGEGWLLTLLDARLLRLVDDELLQVLLFAIRELGEIYVGAAAERVHLDSRDLVVFDECVVVFLIAGLVLAFVLVSSFQEVHAFIKSEVRQLRDGLGMRFYRGYLSITSCTRLFSSLSIYMTKPFPLRDPHVAVHFWKRLKGSFPAFPNGRP